MYPQVLVGFPVTTSVIFIIYFGVNIDILRAWINFPIELWDSQTFLDHFQWLVHDSIKWIESLERRHKEHDNDPQ